MPIFQFYRDFFTFDRPHGISGIFYLNLDCYIYMNDILGQITLYSNPKPHAFFCILVGCCTYFFQCSISICILDTWWLLQLNTWWLLHVFLLVLYINMYINRKKTLLPSGIIVAEKGFPPVIFQKLKFVIHFSFLNHLFEPNFILSFEKLFYLLLSV